MTFFSISIFALQLFLGFVADTDINDGWRGIKVFESKREYVEKVLGKPVKSNHTEFFYEADGNWIRVLYAEGDCTCPESVAGGYKVKRDTVLEYTVNFRHEISLSALGIIADRFERTPEPHRIGFYVYEDNESGIRLITFLTANRGELVESLSFYPPSDKASKLKCGSDPKF